MQKFQEVFNIEQICRLSSKKEIRRFARDDFNNLLEHFAPLFSFQEIDARKEEFKTFKGHVISERKKSPKVSDFHLFSYILKNADFLEMKNFSLFIELTFAVSPSTAHVERSFNFQDECYQNKAQIFNA